MRMYIYAIFWVVCGWCFTETEAQITVSVPGGQAEVGEELRIPVLVSGLSGGDITSVQFSMTYAGDVLNVTGIETSGTLSEGLSAFWNSNQSGQVDVAIAGTSALVGEGVLIVIVGTVTGKDLFGERIFTPGFDELIFSNHTGQEITSTYAGNPYSVTGLSVRGAALSVSTGNPFIWPVLIGNTTGSDITAFQLSVVYDTAKVEINRLSTTGSLSESGSMTTDRLASGNIKVAYAGTEPLVGEGALFTVEATALADGNPALEIQELLAFNSDGNRIPLGTAGVGARLPRETGAPGDLTTLFIPMGNVDGLGITAYQFTLRFNPNIYQFRGTHAEGTLTEGKAVLSNENEVGLVSVAWADAYPLKGDAPLVGLDFDILAPGDPGLSFMDYKVVVNGLSGGENPAGGLEGFLTLPFQIEAGVQITQGWYYDDCELHAPRGAIDYDATAAGYTDTFPVLAAADGVVFYNGQHPSSVDIPNNYGNIVILKHLLDTGEVYFTMYAHLRESPGLVLEQRVNRGEVIGFAGDTGGDYAVHLHFEVRKENLFMPEQLGTLPNSALSVDPYDIQRTRLGTACRDTDLNRLAYPDPISGPSGVMGEHHLWTTDPPSYAFMVTSVAEITSTTDEISLLNFPNPFNDKTTLVITLHKAGYVDIRIYDLIGREVAVIAKDDYLSSGVHQVSFKPANLRSGTYVAILNVGSLKQQRTLILVR